MTSIRMLFIEDAKFKGDRHLSSLNGISWLGRYVKLELRAFWVSDRNAGLDILRSEIMRLRPSDCVFLSFHGAPGKLLIGGEEVNLVAVAHCLKGGGRSKSLIISSCETVRISKKEMRRFKIMSGFDSVIGYETKIRMSVSARAESRFLLDWLTG